VNTIRNLRLAATLAATILAPALAASPAHADYDAELAQKLANPVASLISVPIQVNYDHGFGPTDGDRVLTNIQPVIPVGLSDDLTMVTRTILPVVWQNDIAGNSSSQFGLGDTLQSFFLVPQAEKTGLGTLTWGAGPAITWPTSTERLLGSGNWAAGPTGIFLFQTPSDLGTITYGALANQQWSFAETRNSVATNATFLQPFLTLTTPTAWTFAVNTESSYNWKANNWSVPVNFAISKLTSIGDQKVQFTGGLGYWATTPQGGPDGVRARLVVTFLFPA